MIPKYQFKYLTYIIVCILCSGCAETNPLFTNSDRQWNRVIAEQPIISGNKAPTFNDIEKAQELRDIFEYKSDTENYGTKDHWVTPTELDTRGAGDCEDFSIYQYYYLRKAGFSSNDLELWMITPVLETFNRDDHSILLVNLNGAKYILDINLSHVQKWESYKYKYRLMHRLLEPLSY